MYKYYDQYRINNINNLICARKFDKANMEIDEYKKLFPKDDYINICEAKLLSYMKRYDEALEILRFMIDSGIKREYVYSSAVLTLADILKIKGNYEEAILYYQKCINIHDSSSTYAIIKVIGLYLNIGEWDKALRFVNDLPTNMHDPMIEIKKAEIYYTSGHNKKALNILNNISDSKLDSENLQHKYYLICKINYLESNHDKVLEYINNCFTTKNKYYWKAYVILAKIKCLNSKEEEAIEMCENVIKLYPLTDAKKALVKIYIKLGMLDEVYDNIERFWGKNKDEYLYNYFYGRLYLLKKDYINAEKCLEKAKSNGHPKSSDDELNYYIMVTKFRLKKYGEVKEMIDNFTNIIHGKDLRFHVINDVNMMRAIINNDYTRESYNINQIQDYSKELALEHVLSSHYYTGDFNSEIFQTENDVVDLFNNIEKDLDDNKKIVRGFCDSYIIYYEKVGYNINSMINFIEVICIPDTHNIITMYPTTKYRESFEMKVKNNTKSRRLSQIDKFYKRYGK